jgi:hypothetical protein
MNAQRILEEKPTDQVHLEDQDQGKMTQVNQMNKKQDVRIIYWRDSEWCPIDRIGY